MGLLKEYDPKQVIITWDGVAMNEGIAEGTFITIARNTRTWTISVGGDGGATRVHSNDRSVTITVTLRMGSATSESLASRVIDEEKDPPTPHVAALSIKDGSGNTLHFAEQAFLDGPADDSFGTEEGSRDWVLLAPVMTMEHGGNKDA